MQFARILRGQAARGATLGGPEYGVSSTQKLDYAPTGKKLNYQGY